MWKCGALPWYLSDSGVAEWCCKAVLYIGFFVTFLFITIVWL